MRNNSTFPNSVEGIHITNFRDIGGYPTEDGRHVKKGQFYRSSPIHFQDDAERKQFQKLHIQYILDFRSNEEAAAAPNEAPDGCNYIQCSAISITDSYQGNFNMEDLIKSGQLKKLSSYIMDVYKLLPFHNPAYQKMFDLLLNGDTPFVFHCSAGKDRTGFCAYLILKTLGVSDGIILRDYMLSNDYRREENETFLKKTGNFPGAEELLYVKEEYLLSSIQSIGEKYTDFHTYLQEEYGIGETEIQKIKTMYLE